MTAQTKMWTTSTRPAPREQHEALVAAIGMARRLAWGWVALLGVVELAILPALRHNPTPLGVDLAALAVTAVFGLAVALLPRVLLDLVDRTYRSGRTLDGCQGGRE